MESSVLILYTTFTFVLNFSLHYSAYGNDISRDARIDQIVLNLALDRLWHLACIDIIYVSFNFLNLQPLIEACPCRVLLFLENPGSTVYIDTPVRGFPFAINEANNDLRFAFITSKLYRLNQNLNAGDPQYSSSDANVFVNQMRLAHTHWEDLVEVIESKDHDPLIIETIYIYSHTI